ncbi:MAG: response regulator transcription factor [Actinomycetota bacterium]|nr:response regulator transcription factor [Actinomycetota bacterium]
MTPTRVFVVAPTPMVRAGLRSMLEAADVVVVGEAEAPAGPVPGPSLSDADVLLVADEESLDETALAVVEDGTQSIVVLSDDEGSVSKLRDLSLRGWGVVPPDAPAEELGAAVAAAAHGLTALPKALADQLLVEPAVVEELSEPPTARERQVLGLLGQGFSNKMIARELQISEHTVKFHISSLYVKLGVSNRAEAVSRGARHGLISL